MLYPETKGRALEDMDGLFGKSDDGDSAVLLARGASRHREGWDGYPDEGDEARMSIEDSTEEDAPLLGP